MAFDESLADRIRAVVGDRGDVTEKQMFGGLAFLLDGKMFCGIVKDELMVRVGPDRYDVSLGKRHVRKMDFNGRPMKGYVFVEPAGCSKTSAVKAWVEKGIDFASSLGAPPDREAKKPVTRSHRSCRAK